MNLGSWIIEKFYCILKHLNRITYEILSEIECTDRDGKEMRILEGIRESDIIPCLRIINYPQTFDSISIHLLLQEDNMSKSGQLLSLQSAHVSSISNLHYFLFQRVYLPTCECFLQCKQADPKLAIVTKRNENIIKVFKNVSKYVKASDGKYFDDTYYCACPYCNKKFAIDYKRDVYRTCQMIKVNIQGQSFQELNVWLVEPFVEFVKNGDVLTLTGYFFMNINYLKERSSRLMGESTNVLVAFNLVKNYDLNLDMNQSILKYKSSSLTLENIQLHNNLEIQNHFSQNINTQMLEKKIRFAQSRRDWDELTGEISGLTQGEEIKYLFDMESLVKSWHLLKISINHLCEDIGPDIALWSLKYACQLSLATLIDSLFQEFATEKQKENDNSAALQYEDKGTFRLSQFDQAVQEEEAAFNQDSYKTLNVLVMTDDVNLVLMFFENLRSLYKRIVYYDKTADIESIDACSNCIIIINHMELFTKKEIAQLETFLESKALEKNSITNIWGICDISNLKPITKKTHAELIRTTQNIDCFTPQLGGKFDIMLDISKSNNGLKGLNINFHRLEGSFLLKNTFLCHRDSCTHSTPFMGENILSFSKYRCSCKTCIPPKEFPSAFKLLQKYYINKRSTHPESTSPNHFILLTKLTFASAKLSDLLFTPLNQSISTSTIKAFSILDAVMAIVLYEERLRCVHGTNAPVFHNDSASLLFSPPRARHKQNFMVKLEPNTQIQKQQRTSLPTSLENNSSRIVVSVDETESKCSSEISDVFYPKTKGVFEEFYDGLLDYCQIYKQ